jgi:hypothetical protein
MHSVWGLGVFLKISFNLAGELQALSSGKKDRCVYIIEVDVSVVSSDVKGDKTPKRLPTRDMHFYQVNILSGNK